MGGKQRWSQQEEAALRQGIDKYGAGKWRHIQKDAEYGPLLAARSNVDLKDKWRNLTADQTTKAAKARSGGGSGGRATNKRNRRERRSETPPPRIAATTKRTAAAAAAAAATAAATAVAVGDSLEQEPERSPWPRQTSNHQDCLMATTAAAAVLMSGSRATSSCAGSGGTRALPATKPEDMVVAAVISLGSQPCTQAAIIQWVQVQYHVGRDVERKLPKVLANLVTAGRLEQQGQRGDKRFKMAPLKYYNHNGTSMADSSPPSGLVSFDMAAGALDQTAFEAAQAAAAAVAEAAEAAARADRLGEAASLFELAARQAEQDDLQQCDSVAEATPHKNSPSPNRCADRGGAPSCEAALGRGESSRLGRRDSHDNSCGLGTGDPESEWLRSWPRYFSTGSPVSTQLPGQHRGGNSRATDSLTGALQGGVPSQLQTASFVPSAASGSGLGSQHLVSLNTIASLNGVDRNSQSSLQGGEDFEVRRPLPPSHAWNLQPSSLQPSSGAAGTVSPSGLGDMRPGLHEASLPYPWPLNMQLVAHPQHILRPQHPSQQALGSHGHHMHQHLVPPKAEAAQMLPMLRPSLWQPPGSMASKGDQCDAHTAGSGN